MQVTCCVCGGCFPKSHTFRKMKCLNHKTPRGSADRCKKQGDVEIKHCQFWINGGRSVDTARRLQVFSPFLSQSVLRNLHLHTHDQKGAARDAGTERERPGLRWGNRADGASVVCSWTLPLLQGMTSAFLSIRTRRTCHGVEGRWGGGQGKDCPERTAAPKNKSIISWVFD